jgi:hypothetical protein
MQNLFLETAKVIRIQTRGMGWVFLSSNRFLDQKLLDREHIVSWSTVMLENHIVGTKFRLIPNRVTVPLSKFSCTAIALIFKLLSECT